MDDEFEALAEDGEVAFSQLHRAFKAELDSSLQNEESTFATRAAYIRYMGQTLAAARELEIDALSAWSTPSHTTTDFNQFYDFEVAVGAVLTQIRIRQGRRNRTYSVKLNVADRQRIRNLLTQISEIVDGMDLPMHKRDAIYNRIAALQAELDRDRTRLDAFAGMLITLGQAGAEVITPVRELIDSINTLLGKAKEVEDMAQLPPPTEQKRLEGPKTAELPTPDNLEDEIPF